jgi:citrate lyase subunit beta / citryl-CoA lyase
MEPVRSMLFTPGHRHDLVEKAIQSGADAVIVDLEDSVAAAEKEGARRGVAALPDSSVPLFVRTNGPDTPMFWDDVVACGAAGVAGVVIPKAEQPAMLSAVDGALLALEKTHGHDPGSIAVIPLIESAAGVRNTYEMMGAAGRVATVMFGGGEQGDLVADLGVEWTPDGAGLHHARAKVLLDARAAGVDSPLDAVFMDFRDLEALRVEAALVRRLGYTGKVAIHPAQVAVINDVFTPSQEELAHHRRIVEAFDGALESGSASIAVDGRMVDYAVARVAQAVLARARLAERAAARRKAEG